jgi:alkylation response protein AidB-like acyl-CoA dehydrogenase
VQPGVERRAWVAADGQLAAELQLTDVPAVRLGAIGLAELEAAVRAAWLAGSAEMVGVASLLFEQTLAYVKTRVQFGKPLGSFQVIQHRLTDCYVALEQGRSMVYRAALAPEAGAGAADCRARGPSCPKRRAPSRTSACSSTAAWA